MSLGRAASRDFFVALLERLCRLNSFMRGSVKHQPKPLLGISLSCISRTRTGTMERETSLELATSTLATLRSTN